MWQGGGPRGPPSDPGSSSPPWSSAASASPPRPTAAGPVSPVVPPGDRGRKLELLSHLIHSQGWKQVLVFTRTKHGANRLADQLEDDGISTSAIHGNNSQSAS